MDPRLLVLTQTAKARPSLVPAFPSHRMTLNQRNQMTGSLMVDLSAAEKPTINNSAATRQFYDLPLHSKLGEKGGARWKDYTSLKLGKGMRNGFMESPKRRWLFHQAHLSPLVPGGIHNVF